MHAVLRHALPESNYISKKNMFYENKAEIELKLICPKKFWIFEATLDPRIDKISPTSKCALSMQSSINRLLS